MSYLVDPNTITTLDAAKAWRDQARAVKDTAAIEATSADATALKELNEAQAAEQAAANQAGVSVAQQNVYNANLEVDSAFNAYNSALDQLVLAQTGGDPQAITSAENTVKELYDKLVAAKEAADAAAEELEAEQKQATELEEEAKTQRAEAAEAQQKAIEAKRALQEANEEYEVADAKVLELGGEAETQDVTTTPTEETPETEGIQEAEHLTQEEIDRLVAEEGYICINSQEEFLKIFQNGEIDMDGKYILNCDIDLSDVENWVPVGSASNPFTGIFNGNGYSINNMTINVTDSNAENIGFFAVTQNAEISNVTFNNATIITPTDFINGSSGVGIIAGMARGTSFTNIDASGTVSGYESVGGIVGIVNDNNNGFIEVGNSYFANINTNVNVDGKYFVGGLIGYVADTSTGEGVATRDLKITNCNTSGNVVFTEEAGGGMIGEAGKTIITINNSTSSVNIVWDNEMNDGDLSFLMETGRGGGFIGCVNGSYIAICNSTYTGNLDVDGDFKGDWYGWYMNDAHVTIYEIPAGLPIDDILNIDGIDALTPVYDANGVPHYEVTVSTLTGLDKMVTMIQANPALADMITFNVIFDFEAMDGMYDPSIYAQYGVVQHLWEDEDGNVHNDVYIDNEIDLETTFHTAIGTCPPLGDCELIDCIPLEKTMVSGLYKDENGNYVVSTKDGLKEVDMEFDYEGQITSITKRLEKDEVRFREYITQMVLYYEQKMHESLKAMFDYPEDEDVPIINKAEYKKLQAMQEAGQTLSKEQQLAMAVFELDYTIMNMVADVTNNKGCGMGGEASFLDETKAIQMSDEQGRPLFTTLNGDELRQRMDENGNLMTDEEGNPIYEYTDGRDYDGLAEVFAQRGYPRTDENGNFLFTDPEGNTVLMSKDEDGNPVYTNADGSPYEGVSDDLEQQLDKYDLAGEYAKLEQQMQALLGDVEGGAYPLGRTSTPNESGEAADSDETEGAGTTDDPTTPENEEEKDKDKEDEEV